MEKRVKDLIIEALINEDKTIFELKEEIGNSEEVIRNTINRSLKPKGIVKETGEFKTNPETNSNRGYKIYHLDKSKLNNNSIDTNILKKLIIPFAKNGIKVSLKESEQKRIKILLEEIKKGEIQDG